MPYTRRRRLSNQESRNRRGGRTSVRTTRRQNPVRNPVPADIDELSSDDYTISSEDLTDRESGDDSIVEDDSDDDSDSNSDRVLHVQQPRIIDLVESDSEDSDFEPNDDVVEQSDEDIDEESDVDSDETINLNTSDDEEAELPRRVRHNMRREFTAIEMMLRDISGMVRRNLENNEQRYESPVSDDEVSMSEGQRDAEDVSEGNSISDVEDLREDSEDRGVENNFDDIVLESDGSVEVVPVSGTSRRVRRAVDELETPAKRSKPNESEKADELGPSTSASPVAVEDGDDGCPICYEDYSSAGGHRLVSLSCGHFFGHSCITRWIHTGQRNASCPSCKQRATTKHIRFHFVKTFRAIDNADTEHLKLANKELRERLMETEKKNAELTVKCAEQGEMVSNMEQMLVQGSSNKGFEMTLTLHKTHRLHSAMLDDNCASRVFDYSSAANFVFAHVASSVFGKFGLKIFTADMESISYAPLFTKAVRAVAYNPNAPELILAGSDDGRVKLYDTLKSCEVATWTLKSPVLAVCWIDAFTAIVGCQNCIIKIDRREPELKTELRRLAKAGIHHISHDRVEGVTFVASFDKLIVYRDDEPIDVLRGKNVKKIRSAAYEPASKSMMLKVVLGNNSCVHQLLRFDFTRDIKVINTSTWDLGLQPTTLHGTDCVFRVGEATYSVVHETRTGALVAHDWSGNMIDKMQSLPYEFRHTHIFAIKAIPHPTDPRLVNIYTLNGFQVFQSQLSITVKL